MVDSVALLRPSGIISLAEPVPRHTQRLYALVDLAALGDALATKVREAEEAIYADPADPLVNWAEDDLRAAFLAANLTEVTSRAVEIGRRGAHQPGAARPLVQPAAAGERPSYAQRLASLLNRRDRRGRGALPAQADRRDGAVAVGDGVCGGETWVRGRVATMHVGTTKPTSQS